MTLQEMPGADLANNFECLTMFCIVLLTMFFSSICMSIV